MSRRRSRRGNREVEEEEEEYEEEEVISSRKRKPRAPKKKLPSRSRKKSRRRRGSDDEEEQEEAQEGESGSGDGDEEEGEAAPELKAQQVFLQAFLGQQSIRESQCAQLVAKLNSVYGGKRSVDKYVTNCNDAMRRDGLFLSVKRGVHEGTGVVYYVLCNTKEDAVVKTAALGLSLPELGYVERVIELIVKSSGMAPRSKLIDARSGDATTRSTPERRANEILNLLQEENYLMELDRGRYGLGIRGCVELVTYVQKYLPDHDIKCRACHLNVFWGLRCPTRGCSVKFHKHCGERWFVDRDAVCPECSSPLTDGVAASEEEEEDEEEEEVDIGAEVDEDEIHLFD